MESPPISVFNDRATLTQKGRTLADKISQARETRMNRGAREMG
jgi:hypothetical protein